MAQGSSGGVCFFEKGAKGETGKVGKREAKTLQTVSLKGLISLQKKKKH